MSTRSYENIFCLKFLLDEKFVLEEIILLVVS